MGYVGALIVRIGFIRRNPPPKKKPILITIRPLHYTEPLG